MTYTDPVSGRQYEVDPATGQARWLDAPPAPPIHPLAAGVPQPPRKRRHPLKWILGGVGVLALVATCSAIANNGGSTTTTAAETSATGAKASAAKVAKPAAAPGIGTAVRDGKFEFTVTKTATRTSVGSDIAGQKAQGKYLLVYLTVKNIGQEAQLFDSSSQKMLGADNLEYSADSAAGIYLEGAQSFLNQINPGNSVKGIVVFDIPTAAKIAEIELHDSPFSGGVKVSLK